MSALKTAKIFLALTLSLAGAIALTAHAKTLNTPSTEKLTIYQDAPNIAPLNLGAPESSQGDAHYFFASLHASKGGSVTGEVFGSKTLVKPSTAKNLNTEQRVTFLFFTFNNRQDQIAVGGVADYASNTPEFSPNQTVMRAILGGTGKYIGARGQLESTHNADGSYRHVFTLLNSPLAKETN